MAISLAQCCVGIGSVCHSAVWWICFENLKKYLTPLDLVFIIAPHSTADMAELVDALVSGISVARRGGSSPLIRTKFSKITAHVYMRVVIKPQPSNSVGVFCWIHFGAYWHLSGAFRRRKDAVTHRLALYYFANNKVCHRMTRLKTNQYSISCKIPIITWREALFILQWLIRQPKDAVVCESSAWV